MLPFAKGEGIDSSIYDKRRIIKTLYSASDGKVVLPVNEEQLNSCTLEDFDIEEQDALLDTCEDISDEWQNIINTSPTLPISPYKPSQATITLAIGDIFETYT